MTQIIDLGKLRFNFKGVWAAGTTYELNDVVTAVGNSYVYINATSTAGNLVTNTTYWSLMVPGVDFSQSYTTGRGTALTIKADGTGLDWIAQTASTNILYVGPGGVDQTTAGKSISVPFASIKYAVSQATSGTVIKVLSGTYSEQLPITVPANVAIVGDSQRTTIISPKSGNSDDGTTLNAQATMFYLSNGSILNKMTFTGMTGWAPGTIAADITTSTIKGVVARLNPASPITTKSPYILECAAMLSGGIGAIVEGAVHSTGNKSMLFHEYTVISDNGVGFWVKDGARAEIVSCFTYYAYFGYSATGGGQIRSLSGNNSYGTYGAFATGYDTSETAITGTLVGQELNFSGLSGTVNVGDTVTSSGGGTATVLNVQASALKVYVRNATGTFSTGNTLTFSSGGTATVSSLGLRDQRGFVLIVNGLATLPKAGCSIQITGDTQAYVVQTVSGTYSDGSSVISLVLTTEKVTGSASGATTTFRYNFSKVRLTGHDFLNIGTGGVTTTNYPGTPTQAPAQGNEIIESFPGRVFYVSTDQDGNLRVGKYFKIDQATGKATLNASAFDLSGLSSLRLGSIGAQVGELISEFSSDATFAAGSNTKVPTEYAVKAYVASKVPDASTANQYGFLRSSGTATYWDQFIKITGQTALGVVTGQALSNQTYSATSLLAASPSITWSLSAAAPSNLSINSSGVLSQSSNLAAGTYNFNIIATDSRVYGALAVKIIVDANAPVFSSASAPNLFTPVAGAQTLTFAQATSAGGACTHTLVSGALPSWATLNSSGTITGNPPTATTVSTTYNFTVRATFGSLILDKTFAWTYAIGYPVGQSLYGTNVGPGTYSWIAPTGVTSVAAVAIGGGHAGSGQWSYGGGAGGGLGYKNNISVTPGTSYTVVVGAGGTRYNGPNYYTESSAPNGVGGNSYFVSTTTVLGQGGGRSDSSAYDANRYIYNGQGYSGGGFVGDGGGRGGNINSTWTCGGAGAGGYSGRGGCYDQGWQSTYGGALGDNYSSTYGTGAGGGVGLIGDNGTDRYGNYHYNPWQGYNTSTGNGSGGGHGPGGTDGYYGENQWAGTSQSANNIKGGDYGGGGGGSGTSQGGGPGGQGGVRIIWGTIGSTVRAFPNSYAADQTAFP